MDLEQVKESIIQILSQHHTVTIKYLSKRLNESRKKIKFVLTHNECFSFVYRNPYNTLYRRKPIWSLHKSEEVN